MSSSQRMLSENFSEKELVCRCPKCCEQPLPDQWRERVLKTVAALEIARRVLQKPITITSGLRCKEHNEAVGGAASSKHLFGQAVDITVEGWTGERLAGAFEILIADGRLAPAGIGVYTKHPNMMHFDTRGTNARWAK